MKLLVIASVGNIDPATNESPVQLGLIDVPDDTKVDFHAPIALGGDVRDAVQSLVTESKRQLGSLTFAGLTEKALVSGLTVRELYDFLVASYSPKHGLEVLAAVINDNPDATAEDGIVALDIALARQSDYRLQNGTVKKAKLILAYIRGGNAADFAKIVNKEMPEKYRGNKTTATEAAQAFAEIERKRDIAVGNDPKSERRVIPAMREVLPEGGPDTLGPKRKEAPATRGPGHGATSKVVPTV